MCIDHPVNDDLLYLILGSATRDSLLFEINFLVVTGKYPESNNHGLQTNNPYSMRPWATSLQQTEYFIKHIRI